MKIKQIVIFIDESGTLPDPNDKVIIVAAVGTGIPATLEKVTKSTRKNLKKKNEAMAEIKFYQKRVSEVIFDRHFHRLKDQKQFNQVLKSLLGQNLRLNHVNSQEDPRVNAADMVAGSILWAKTGKDKKFYDLFKEKIISEKTLNWKEVKRKFLGIKKLARTGVNTHP